MNKDDFSELIEQARSANLLEYFRSSGYKVEQHSNNFYVKEYPGLCIKPDSNQWYSHYTDEGRTNNSIDCLTIILGRSFNQAVFELTGKDISSIKSDEYPKTQKPQYTSPPRPTQKDKHELEMPKQSENMRRIFAYFCQTRKIPAAIVEELVHKHLLYQSENSFTATANGREQTFRNANAIFVHKDNNGKTIGAEIQGTNSYKRYKGVAAGTGDSAFMFTPVPASDNKIKRAYIFESAIDLMSFYTFCDKQKLPGSVLVSMSGLKASVPKKLEAEGVQIVSCVDNDDAGRKFEKDNGFIRSQSVKNYLDNNGFKDWNELLIYKNLNPDFNILSAAVGSKTEQNENKFEEENYSRGR